MQPSARNKKEIMGDFLEFIAIPKNKDPENAEIITALMSEFAFDVFDATEERVKAYGFSANFTEQHLQELMQTIAPFSDSNPEIKYLEKENWNALWESNYFEPIVVDDLVRLHAVFQPKDPSVKWDLTIQPKMSFGTGHHSTTQLMISLMLSHKYMFPNTRVLDMGAGTGILAIVAEKLESQNIDAVDIEEWAVQNIDENAELNDCKHITAHHGDANYLTIMPSDYDVILANIHKQVLISDGAIYSTKLNPNGYLFLSGFYTEDANDILQHYEKLNFQFIEQKSLNNWCAVVLQKK